MRDGHLVTVEVTSDGAGLVSHAGTVLLAQVSPAPDHDHDEAA
jgi:hypothetical protein